MCYVCLGNLPRPVILVENESERERERERVRVRERERKKNKIKKKNKKSDEVAFDLASFYTFRRSPKRKRKCCARVVARWKVQIEQICNRWGKSEKGLAKRYCR